MKVEHVKAALSSIATNLYNRSDKHEDPDLVHFLRTNGGHLRNLVAQLRKGFRLECNHVVVTRYTKPNGKVLVHAYGPFTRDEAFNKRRKWIAEHNAEGEKNVELSVHKILDVDGENIYHRIRGME